MRQQVKEQSRDPCPFKCYSLPSGQASEKLGEYLQYRLRHQDDSLDSDSTEESVTFARLLAELQRENHSKIGNIVAKSTKSEPSSNVTKKAVTSVHKQDKCLLCLGDFSSRGSLTKHNSLAHCRPGGILCQALPCPECERLGKARCIIDGPVQWSIHAERFHGIENTPNPPSSLAKMTTLTHKKRFALAKYQERCLICGDIFESGSGFSRHVTMIHEKAGFFESAFNCPECERQEMKVPVEDATAWRIHVAKTHAGGRFSHLLAPKRQREEENEEFEVQRVMRKKTRIEIPASGSSLDLLLTRSSSSLLPVHISYPRCTTAGGLVNTFCRFCCGYKVYAEISCFQVGTSASAWAHLGSLQSILSRVPDRGQDLFMKMYELGCNKNES
jgi:hypothetical protein